MTPDLRTKARELLQQIRPMRALSNGILEVNSSRNGNSHHAEDSEDSA